MRFFIFVFNQNRQSYSELFKEIFGIDILLASSYEGALAIAEKENIDLALLDFSMPGKNGLELAKELKRRYKDLKIVIVSGLAEIELLKPATREGICIDCINKAVLPVVIKEKMRQWRQVNNGERGASSSISLFKKVVRILKLRSMELKPFVVEMFLKGVRACLNPKFKASLRFPVS